MHVQLETAAHRCGVAAAPRDDLLLLRHKGLGNALRGRQKRGSRAMRHAMLLLWVLWAKHELGHLFEGIRGEDETVTS